MATGNSFTTDLLVKALRRGRGSVQQAEQGFQRGAGQDLAALFARQGLGGQQAGLTTALAEQGRRRGQEQEVESDYFNRDLANTETADLFRQASERSLTGQILASQNQVGMDAERRLRQSIQRVRDLQQRNELLDLIGQITGTVATAALL